MNPFLTAGVWMIAGLCLLATGGELLVRGASKIATALRVSPLIVGLTVVAFGTSAPELAVVLQSVFSGTSDLAMGNVVGSNIANILFILGLSALIAPLFVNSQLIRFDVPLMLVATGLTWWLARDGSISRIDGCLLFGMLITYLLWSARQARRESQATRDEFTAEYGIPPSTDSKYLITQVLVLLSGLVLLGLGSRWLVDGAADTARLLGVSELMIGLTIVAVGTSLPEAVTSIVASFRGERDIAVGNVVGSNLFNLLAVLGFSGLVAPRGITVSPDALAFDIPVMMIVSVACLPIFFTGRRIARWEGGLFFCYYLIYLTYLVLVARNVALPSPTWVVTAVFLLPLTAITLLVWISAKRARRPEEGV